MMDRKTSGMPLSTFLLKPMQRITKYPLIISKVFFFSVVDLLKLKGTHTVNFSSSLYIINQKPMINRTHFHCITTWVASSSG